MEIFGAILTILIFVGLCVYLVVLEKRRHDVYMAKEQAQVDLYRSLLKRLEEHN